MRLDQFDYPVWETIYDTAFYQMAGGCNGIVHEARYQLADFDKAVAKYSRKDTKHTPEQLLKYHYAFLRGGTRPFGKHWGTAIYGQCDPAISPQVVTLAYDAGAATSGIGLDRPSPPVGGTNGIDPRTQTRPDTAAVGLRHERGARHGRTIHRLHRLAGQCPVEGSRR
jgi:hypothetical protein